MGTAIARRFLDTGQSVTVWNRTVERTCELQAAGALVAEDMVAALAASPLTIVAIAGHEHIQQILAGADVRLANVEIANVTTGEPNQARELHEWVRQRGGQLLAGCILGYPAEVRTQQARIRYSGSLEVWDRHAGLLRSLAASSEFLGTDPGLAAVLDGAFLTYFIPVLTASLEAAAFGAAQGLPFGALRSDLVSIWPTIERFINDTVDKITAEDYSAKNSTLETYLGAVHGVAKTAAELGLPSNLIRATREILLCAADDGHAIDDLASIYKTSLKCVVDNSAASQGDPSPGPDPRTSS
jgi:3-hydroxyisobutyrate dehydrogenase-like beta-hydroxyacid dehydrogenase